VSETRLDTERQAVVFEYELGKGDYLDAVRILLRGRRMGFLYRPWFQVTLAALGLLGGVQHFMASGRIYGPAVLAVVCAALPACVPGLSARGAVKAGARRGRVRMTADETGVEVVAAGSQARSDWSEFGSCVETSRVFALRSPGRAGRCTAVIAKRGARTPADVERLRALIGSRLLVGRPARSGRDEEAPGSGEPGASSRP
jgi:hypothetical protein